MKLIPSNNRIGIFSVYTVSGSLKVNILLKADAERTIKSIKIKFDICGLKLFWEFWKFGVWKVDAALNLFSWLIFIDFV